MTPDGKTSTSLCLQALIVPKMTMKGCGDSDKW